MIDLKEYFRAYYEANKHKLKKQQVKKTDKLIRFEDKLNQEAKEILKKYTRKGL